MADPDETLADNTQKNYEEVCKSYNAITDFRGKLLGFLPFASGAGLLLLALNPDFRDQPWWIFFAIGLFGSVVTLGLFSYELRGMQRCLFLIELGTKIEGHALSINGQFKLRPKSGFFIGASFAGCLIYPMVLAAWTFVAFVGIGIFLAENIGASTVANFVGFDANSVNIGLAGAIALGVFIIGFEASRRWVKRQRSEAKRRVNEAPIISPMLNEKGSSVPAEDATNGVYFYPGFLEPLGQLRDLDDEVIIKRHDEVVKSLEKGASPEMKSSYLEQTQRYLSVLNWKEAKEQAGRMENLTKSINLLTIFVAFVTFVGVFLTALSLWPGW